MWKINVKKYDFMLKGIVLKGFTHFLQILF